MDEQQVALEFNVVDGAPSPTVVSLSEYRHRRERNGAGHDTSPAATEIRWDWCHQAPRVLSAAAIAHRGRMLRHLASTAGQD